MKKRLGAASNYEKFVLQLFAPFLKFGSLLSKDLWCAPVQDALGHNEWIFCHFIHYFPHNVSFSI